MSKDVSLIVTNDNEKFNNFELLRNRISDIIELFFTEWNVVISEKLAKLLNVKVGDEIEIINSNDTKAQAKIGSRRKDM